MIEKDESICKCPCHAGHAVFHAVHCCGITGNYINMDGSVNIAKYMCLKKESESIT